MSERDEVAALVSTARLLWPSAAADRLVLEAFEAGIKFGADMERRACADVAGGWTGPINTVESCAVVSEVCRSIAATIRARGKGGG